MSDSEGEDGVHCKAACCANHVCAKVIDTQQDIHVICSLCRDAVYCSEACRNVDWLEHECPNAKMMSTPNKIVAKPYFYEDHAPEEVLAEVEADPKNILNQAYVFGYCGADMVTQMRFESLSERARPYSVERTKRGGDIGRGSKPSDDLIGRTYTITVTGQDGNGIEAKGYVGVNSIWKGNTQNSRANKIASLFAGGSKNTGSIVLWPDSKQFTGERMFANQGDMTVRLDIFRKEAVSVEFELLKLKPYNWFERAGRGVAKYFEARLRAKFDASKNKEANIKNMQLVQARTSSGMQVNLTFLVLPRQEGMVELVDVEFLVPVNQLKEYTSKTPTETLKGLDLETAIPTTTDRADFRCDPRDVNQMVGLTMALELLLATPDVEADQLKTIQNAAGIIRKHTRTLLVPPKEGAAAIAAQEVPMEVNTAVYTAVNFLHDHQLIERRAPAMDDGYYNLHKNDSLGSIRAEVQSLRLGAGEGAKFGTRAKRFFRGTRGKEKGRLRAIQRIISERLTMLERQFGEGPALTNATYIAWQELGTEVANKLNTTD